MAARFFFIHPMKHRSYFLAIVFACLSCSGCGCLANALLDSVLGIDQVRDGRDQDRDGLTQRDKVARAEEQTLRNWDTRSQRRQWKDDDGRQKATESAEFKQEWQSFISRNRD